MVYFWDGLLVDGYVGNRAARGKSRVSRLVSFYRLENDSSRQKKSSNQAQHAGRVTTQDNYCVYYEKHLIKVRIDFGGMFLSGMLVHTA